MSNLVFLESQKMDTIPFTTSEVIAEYAKVKPESVDRLIRRQIQALEQFGTVGFEIRVCPHRTGATTKKIYHLSEEQATLLIAFLQNTEPVVRFKTELVRQFYLMKTELFQRKMRRIELKPVRRELTDTIRDNPGSGKWDYKLFTDLAYKAVTGKNAVQLRKERGAKKNAAAIDYMTAEEIAAVTKKQYQISALIELGMDYHQIKSIVLERKVLGRIA